MIRIRYTPTYSLTLWIAETPDILTPLASVQGFWYDTVLNCWKGPLGLTGKFFLDDNIRIEDLSEQDQVRIYEWLLL